jgi:hypothetical protein
VDIPAIVHRIAGDDVEVHTKVVKQSPEIAAGVDTGGAGDQGIMIGYACDETPELLPLEVVLSRRLNQYIFEKYPYDGKTQITIAPDGTIDSIVTSFQNVPHDELEKLVREFIDANNLTGKLELHINPAGDWNQGGFDADTGKKLLCLYRGMKSGYITSVTLLNNGKFLAVNNIDRTVHIYDLDINNNDFSFSNIIYGIISDIKEIYPKLRIRYQNILQNEEGSYYKNDFSEKGSMLYSENNDELNVISYNGFAFKIKINFSNFEYKVMSKVEYIEKTMPKISLCNSGYEK